MALGNMRRYLYIIALFVLVIVSCTPDEIGTPFVEGQEVTLTASMANSTSDAKQMPGKQRVSGKDAGATIDLTWNAGDEILVSVGDKSAVFTLSSSENSSLGTFTGKMPADGSVYSVSYPVDYSDDVLTHQTYVENGFGNGLMKMSTKQNGTLNNGFVLSADNAVLGLQLTGSQTLGEIVLTNTATTKTYTLHCDGVVLTAEAILFYIVVPVKDWTNGMRVEVYDNDGDIILMKEKAGEIMFSATDAMVMPTLQTRERGKRIGIFSVGEGKYVSFSQGNLQYQQSTDEWRFAREQYEYIGAENIKDGALADKIDLFGWSANNTTAPFGVSTSMSASDYAGDFVDWGVNAICGDAPGTWRTLSVDEWGYLFQGRKNATQLYSKGNIDGLRGMIILPDNWVMPEGLHFTAQPTNLTMELDINTYTQAEWQRMEEAGAVFLCLTGRRDGTKIDHLEYYGGYWSSSKISNSNHVSHMYYNYRSKIFRTDYKEGDHSYGTNGRAVRLVHDTIVPEAVDLGLSVKWATFNVGATSPEDYGDYFAWGETEPKEIYSWATYKWCEGTNKTMTKYCSDSNYGNNGFTDNKMELDLSDDAARANWGGNWRMPTDAELTELREQCTWTWTTQDGVNGYKVTSKKSGYTDKSIFLPAAGYRFENSLRLAGDYGYFWSNSLTTDGPNHACFVRFGQYYALGVTDFRRYGFAIRPVYDDRVE